MEKFTLANYVYMFHCVFRRRGNGRRRDSVLLFKTGLQFHIDFISLY